MKAKLVIKRIIYVVNNIFTYYKNDKITKQYSISKLARSFEVFRYISVPSNELNRIIGLVKIFMSLGNVDGDVVECGVGRGKSLVNFLAITLQMSNHRKLYGFDSFEGFPEPSIFDKSKRNPQKGDWSNTSKRLVEQRFELAGYSDQFKERTKLIKGYFSDTLKDNLPQKIAFLHIDADLYQSYLDVLSESYSRLSSGAVVIFDEYGMEKWPGAKKACDEFMADKPESIILFNDLPKYGFKKE